MRLLLFFICCLSANIYAQCGGGNRFKKQVFPNITVTKDIIYGNADRYDVFGANNPQPIKLDFYAPAGDTMQRRPLVLLFFGGAFLLGDKGDADVKAWCDSLAHCGYVAASVNYRLGYNQLSGKSAIRATYRGVQDARAAIRFLKEKYQQYKIDTNRIFIAGESAGAIIGLHTTFLRAETDRPAETYGITGENQDLGCMDCSGNTYAHTVEVKGLISLWGAINDVNNITANERTPTLLIHGTDDAIVNINQGPPFSLPNYPDVYGSIPLHARLDALGIYNEFYPYQGQPHLFYGLPTGVVTFPNQYWQPVFTQGKQFLYTALQQICVSTENAQNTVFDLKISPNPAHDYFTITLPEDGFEPCTLVVSDINGKMVLSQKIQENRTEIALQGMAPGIYLAKAQTKNKIFRTKIVVE
jgi:acetyl esterase/lipase